MTGSTLIVEDMEAAAQRLKAAVKGGGIIAYPTETFYGLGVDPFNEQAVESLFRLKGRPEDKPILIVIKDIAELSLLVSEIPEVAVPLIERYWPGPLTLLFMAKQGLPRLITGRANKVGVRLSGSAITRRLLEIVRTPLTSTSANPSGSSPATDYRKVMEYFPEGLDVVIKAERLRPSKPSTVVDVTGQTPVIVREGAVRIEGL